MPDATAIHAGPAAAADFLSGGGETGDLIRRFDWSATALGPIPDWPVTLKLAVGLMVRSAVPIVMLWGEDGYMIYNDAYSGFAGGRHPGLLGSRVREGWPEVADFNDNVMRVCLAGGTLAYKDQELTLYRHGEPEQVWMNLDYSPIPDETGRPLGVVAIVVETTERVLADRHSAAEQDRLRKLFEQAPGFMAMLEGPEHVFAFANPAFLDLIGQRTANARPVRSVIPELVGQGVLELLDACFDSGQPFVGLATRISLQRRQGEPAEDRYVDFVIQPVRDDDGKVSGIFLEGADVTERVTADVALRESELRFRQLAESIDDVFYVVESGSGVLLYLSPAFESVWGRPRDWPNASSARLLETVHPDDRMRVEQALAAQKKGQGTELEYRVLRPDGTERWVFDRAFPVQSDGARRIAGLAEDITDRKLAEAALRESEARFREVADAAPVLIWMSDASQGCTWFNTAWLGFTGATMARSLGFGWADDIHPDDVERCLATYRQAFARRVPFRMDYRLRHRDGRYRVVDDTGVPRLAADGTFLGYIGSCMDVTDARVAEAELRRLTESLEARVEERTAELAAANRQLMAQIRERERVEATLTQMQRLEAVGQLTSGVAHDFNNLLTVVLGNLGFVQRALEKAGANPRELERLRMMRAAAERGATLTSQLLAFSRRQRLEARTVDLNDTVMKMRDLLLSSMGGSVKLETHLSDDIWPALVDPTQIELVILNLAINARDAMQVGGTLVVETANVSLGETSRPEEPAPGDYVMVSVSDSGTGKSPDVLVRAFEPFFTTKPVGKGSGLGLAQVYGFAKQSGGGVSIETEVGRGTRVKVFLPRAAGLETPAADPVPEGRSLLAGRARRVLVVDDDGGVRQVTASLLQDMGCAVMEAGSGAAALEILLRTGPFDLLVVDFAMPGMNGMEVARTAKSWRPACPVLFLTGYADLTALDSVPEDEILQKPFRDEELFSKVRRLLEPGLAAS